jgi:hypothetical protein
MKSAALKAFALVLSTTFCVLGAELAVRIVVPQTLSIWSYTRDGIVIHQRNVRGHVTPAGRRLDTNSDGMRDIEHPTAKPPGTYRILLMGDSFMEAVQLDWEQTLAALLDERLNAAPETVTRIEVINASVSGWGTDDQRTYYLRYGREFDPDLVLIGMTLHNDLFDNLAMRFSVVDDGRLIDRPREEIPGPLWIRMKIQEWLASHSHLYRLISGTLHAEAVRAGGQQLRHDLSELVRATPSPKVQRGWAMTLGLLDRFDEEVHDDGGELAVFLIPLLVQIDADVLRGYLEEMELEPSQLDLDGPQRTMREWGRERGVAVFDLLPEFREASKHETLYLEADGHWNERGHELGARLVARDLIAAGLVPTTPAPGAHP